MTSCNIDLIKDVYILFNISVKHDCTITLSCKTYKCPGTCVKPNQTTMP